MLRGPGQLLHVLGGDAPGVRRPEREDQGQAGALVPLAPQVENLALLDVEGAVADDQRPLAAGGARQPLDGRQRREGGVDPHVVEDELGQHVRGAGGGVEEDLVPGGGRLLAGQQHRLHRAVGADGDARDDLVAPLGEGRHRDQRQVDLAGLEHGGAAGRLGQDQLDAIRAIQPLGEGPGVEEGDGGGLELRHAGILAQAGTTERRGGGGAAGGSGCPVDLEDVVEGVALGRHAAGGADQVVQRPLAERLRHRRAGHVVDALLEHGAVEVVDAEAERHLRQPLAHRDPVGLHVVEVVEVEPRHRGGAEGVVAGRLGVGLADHVVLGVEGQRDEDLEPVGLVLQLAQPAHVVDALVEPLDVAVEHGGVRPDAEPVRGPVDLDPLVGGGLVVADLSAHPRREDLGAAAGDGGEAGVAQLGEHLLVAHAELLRPVVVLDGGEGLDGQLRPGRPDAPQQAGVVVPGQRGVEPGHDVDLGDAEGALREHLLHRLVEGHGVALGGLLVVLAGERAELAGGDADVGRVEVDVAVVEGQVAVAGLPHVVGERPHRGEIRRLEEPQGVGVAESLPGQHLVGDGAEAVALERPASQGGDHVREPPWGRAGAARARSSASSAGWAGRCGRGPAPPRCPPAPRWSSGRSRRRARPASPPPRPRSPG